MSFPRYERYKESGVEWLGEVPEHWEVCRLDHSFRHIRDKVSDKDFPALSVTKNGVVPQLETAAKTDDGDNRKLVRSGDFVINGRSDRNGSAGLSALEGSVSLINLVLRPIDIDGSFTHFLMRSEPFQQEFYRNGKGIVADLWSTGYDEMRDIILALPTRDEQLSIVAFLSQETRKIDALIEEQRRLIELLKEKRQAVISHAVLIPDRTSTQLRHHIIRIEQGWSPIAADRDPEPGEWAVLKLSAVKRGEFDDTKLKALPPEADIPLNLELKAGDFLVTRANTPDLVGDSCYVSSPAPHLIFSDLIYRLVLNGKTMSGEFLNLALQSALGRSQAKRDARGSSQSMVKLGHDQILSWLVPVPPLSEQKQIVEAVKGKTDELSRSADTCRQAIYLLGERRSALISAAVTGKIDVRNYAKANTKETA